MVRDGMNYREAVEAIKGAILQAQYAAAKSVNAQQLQLYFAVGGYLSHQSEIQAWGSGAIDTISEMLQKDLPGLRGFSGRNLRLMRTFYREWSPYLIPTPNLELANSELPNFINVEELGVRDTEDIDERVLEQGIVQNIKQFIMTFGKGFSFVSNQFHLDAFGVDQYVDLLFFNRDLNCLVAVELKNDPFKTAYLGQLSGYLRILDDFERREHENPSIGLVLCKDMNTAFVDYMIRDYTRPMGVATYKTSKDMSHELLDALPPIDALKALLEGDA